MSLIPMIRRQGYDMVVGSGQRFSMMKGASGPLVEKLYQVGRRTITNPTMIKGLSDSGASIATSKSPEDFTTLLKSENNRFAQLLTKSKIQTE